MGKITDKKVIRNGIGFFERTVRDHLGAYAAQAAYFLIMSFIPFTLFLTTIIKYTPLTYRTMREAIISVVPSNIQPFILNIVAEAYSRNNAIMPIAVITTLWSAGKGMQALINGFNVIYHVKETRNWLINRIYSIFWTVLFIVSLISSLLILVMGKQILGLAQSYVPILSRIISYIVIDSRFMVFLGLFVIFELLYKVLPNRKTSFRSQIPGAAFSAAAWSLFSLLFSYYFNLFPDSFHIYGSLAAIIILMLWLDICMYIMLLGAEINIYFEVEFRKMEKSVKNRWKDRGKKNEIKEPEEIEETKETEEK